ncbi:MAG: MmcB family DNA repair protein [Hyphomicrobiaceae bacterium]
MTDDDQDDWKHAQQARNGLLDAVRGVDPTIDGRQSEAALEIARGVMRLLGTMGEACITELVLPNGRRADVVSLSANGIVRMIEVKSCLEDFRADTKWPDYFAYCDDFYFAVGPQFPSDVLPPSVGLIIGDRYGADLIRSAPHERMAAARRKTMHLAFARAAAARLTRLTDPDAAMSAQMRP